MSSNQFSATDSALGYLYQVRVALLWSLRKIREGDTDFLVSVETLDDVAFERNDAPDTLLQTKHHISKKANLTNSSPDIWKTLRIWLESSPELLASNAKLVLLTTENAAEESASFFLKDGASRDIVKAEKILTEVAQKSRSVTNKKGYQVFNTLDLEKKLAVLNAVIVIDGAPDIKDLYSALKEEIFWAAPKGYHDSFQQRLEGWWYGRVLNQLYNSTGLDKILAQEIEAEMHDLREQFKIDSLPVDYDLLDFSLDEDTKEEYQKARFVMQIELTRANRNRIANAIRDYYRAFTQRSRWTREDLLLVGELDKYEKRLVEEWEIKFESLRDEIGDDAVDSLKEKVARQVLSWAESTHIPIRKEVSESFLTRGSFHMLADNGVVGWHPEFKERLKSLLV